MIVTVIDSEVVQGQESERGTAERQVERELFAAMAGGELAAEEKPCLETENRRPAR